MDTSSLNPYAAAIAMERAKIAQYEARIRECRSKIEALEGLTVRPPDAVDMAIERELQSAGWHDRSGPSEVDAGTHRRDSGLESLAAAAALHTATARPALPMPPAPVNPFMQSGSEAFNERSGERSGAPIAQLRENDQSAEYVLPKREVSPQALELLRFLSTPASSEAVHEYAQTRGFGMNRAALSTFLYSYRTKYGFIDALADSTYILSFRGRQYVYEPSRRNIKFEAPDAAATASGVDSTQVVHLTRTEGADRDGGS